MEYFVSCYAEKQLKKQGRHNGQIKKNNKCLQVIVTKSEGKKLSNDREDTFA